MQVSVWGKCALGESCRKELQTVLTSGKEGYGILWGGLAVSVMLFLKKPKKVQSLY